MTPWLSDPDVDIYVGDALDVLRGLPDGSVDCCVTSPPYWGLRDYGTGQWDGGEDGCDHVKDAVKNRGEDFRKRGEERGYAPGSNFANYGDRNATASDFADVCGKCGATRVDRQLGLEATPDLYVAAMVAVFAEVRRVLADHGTLWLNIGDSYAGSYGNQGRKPERGTQRPINGDMLTPVLDGRYPDKGSNTGAVPDGLKPKDLCGIPWRLAFALQQPHYTGRIKDERDRIWLAAMLDAEGCIHIHRRKAGADSGAKFTKKDGTTVSYARTQDTYGVMVSIDNTSEAIIDRCHEIAGQGSRYTHEAGVGKSNRKQTLHRITLTGQESRALLRELYPHLVAKQQQARIAIASPSSGDEAARAHHAIKALHAGELTDTDYPPPEGMWERGWYLRSEIIWSKKPNPMPESVRDRPTKAHEQVFLLSKRPSYWFDQEAVREAITSEASIIRNRSTPRTVVSARKAADPSVAHPESHFKVDTSAGRNVRSVWDIATQPYPEAHFATFPEELARRAILAGCPVAVCSVCGKARERIVASERRRPSGLNSQHKQRAIGKADGNLGANGPTVVSETVGWSDCGHNAYRPGSVLDPFLGSGTTAHVARKHGRRCVGIELNETYAQLAARRLQQLSLLADGDAA